MIKIETKKIGNFLQELTPVEYRYLELTMQIVSGIKTVIERYNLTKEEFCELFGINAKVYERYVCGNFNYSLHDMALLNFVYQKLEKERIEQEEMIRVTTERHD